MGPVSLGSTVTGFHSYKIKLAGWGEMAPLLFSLNPLKNLDTSFLIPRNRFLTCFFFCLNLQFNEPVFRFHRLNCSDFLFLSLVCFPGNRFWLPFFFAPSSISCFVLPFLLPLKALCIFVIYRLPQFGGNFSPQKEQSFMKFFSKILYQYIFFICTDIKVINIGV